MDKRRKESHKGLIIALCVIAVCMVIAFGGVVMYWIFQSEEPQTTQKYSKGTESEQDISETDASFETEINDVNDALYCEEIEEGHIAFDTESGLQYADNQLLIMAAQGVTKEEVERLIAPYHAEITGMIEATNVYQLKFSDSYTKEELERIGEELIINSEIESYEKNTVMDIDISAVYPDDKKWENEWRDKTPAGINWGMEAIHAPEAWGYYDKMQEVNVGIYDNMFYDHEDLEFAGILCNMRGKELNDSHGTHVSGTIGAGYNNDKGVCGVFPKARMYGVSYKKMEQTYDSNMGIKVAFTYLIDMAKCKVINMSIGWDVLTFAASRGNENALNAIENGSRQIGDYLQVLLNVDTENDFVICKSAGNGNSTQRFIEADDDDMDAPYGYIKYTKDNKIRYEKYEDEEDFEDRIVCARDVGCVLANDFIASISNRDIKNRILVVGAAENLNNGQYKVADFSNCGYRVDVLAPGVGIYSTVEKNKYEDDEWDGTSMAAPHATGVAAMCFSVNDNLSGAQVVDIIKQTSEGNIQYTIDNGSQQFGGYSIINAEKAVEKALEKKKDKKTGENAVTRDIVLVLDRSGSMSGYPMEQTKEAAVKFVDTVFEKESQVSVVAYDSTASVECGLTNNQQELAECIDEIYEGGGTNMYAGLEQADSILQGSQAQRKIIVLMSDGLPNEGVSDGFGYSEPLLQYAEEMKNRGYYIYTLGFFTGVSGYELTSAQQLMEGIASPGLHYEVNSAEDLVFFFDDIADQITGTRFVYIRIACPVDVTVSCNGETLSSKPDSENTRTSFGALTYENVQEDTETEYGDYSYEDFYDSLYGNEESVVQDRVKVLRLNMDEDYDVEIEGYDKGTMDYTVSYPNENGEYDDVREFPDIAVTASTKALSNTGESKETYLKVDENGDGKYETTYKTEANGKMEEVKDRTLLYLVILGVVILLLSLLILILVLVRISDRKKKNQRKKGWETAKEGYIYGAFGVFEGQSYPMGRGEQCIVGRDSNCDIQLKHSQVSRTHCIIQMLPDGVYQVTDCSLNGTFYNNQRLTYKEPYRLPKGALLAIGDADNVLELK